MMNDRNEIAELARGIYIKSKAIFDKTQIYVGEGDELILDFIEEYGFWESIYLIYTNDEKVSQNVKNAVGVLTDKQFTDLLLVYFDRKGE